MRIHQRCGRYVKASAYVGVFLLLKTERKDNMPTKSKVPCRHPGCPKLVEAGTKYCAKHKPMHPEEYRPEKKIYGYKWQKVRKRFLETHPLCEECKKQGRYVKATDVDHVIPHRGDMDLFWDWDNYQALCHSCHSKKTAREDMHPEYRY